MASRTTFVHLWSGISIALMIVIQNCLTDITTEPSGLPAFQRVDCSEGDTAELCIAVLFASDGSRDMLLVSPRSEDAPTVMKGTLKSNVDTKVVVILNDEFNPMTTIVFKSHKAGLCSRFSVDIENAMAETQCINRIEQPDVYFMRPLEMDGVSVRRKRQVRESSNKVEMDPIGYKMDVVVFYDSCFAKKFGKMATTRIRAIMAVVDEMYSERDTLQTKIEFSDKFPIVYKTFSHWCRKCWPEILSGWGELGNIARKSGFKANAYVFLTYGAVADKYPVGLAVQGVTCHPNKRFRTSISRYYDPESWKSADVYTAETIAHEIGHNLGMGHDHECGEWKCSNETSKCGPRCSCGVGKPRKMDGAECFGYMDYKLGNRSGDYSNQWSPCSVQDFRDYIEDCGGFCRKSKPFCLKTLG